MIESIFILSICMGFVLFILAIEQESVIYSLTSILMFIFTMAGTVYIRAPGTPEVFSEPGLVGLCIAFIAINIIWTIILYMDLNYWKRKKMR